MKRGILSTGPCVALALTASAGMSNAAFEIWPTNAIPFARANARAEHMQPIKDDVIRLADVSVPQVVVTPVPCAEKPMPAVVVCPGGGYDVLAWNLEGIEVAQWLKIHGFAAVVLKYRVPDQRDAALADAQRALRWTRAHAEDLKIDPARVGIMGFSAGANLAVRAATNFKRPIYDAVDDVDRMSCRPDFQLAIYPWDIIARKDPSDPWHGHEGMEVRRSDYPVDADVPPAFVVQSEDDFCLPETSLAYAAALKRAGVPVELHVFEKGGREGHGYGIRRYGCPTDAWPDLAITWLTARVGSCLTFPFGNSDKVN